MVVDLASFTGPVNFSSTVNLLLAVSAISLVPFIMISTTCFVRVIVVLSMIRMALGTQQSPPNPILLSLAMFITMFIMGPTMSEMNKVAIKPYQEGVLNQQEAIEAAILPVRTFMLKYAREQDLALFLDFSGLESVQDISEIPIFVIIPAFIISELKTAFQVGFLIFIPFVVIDLIVSNVLLSLGMFMLSPVMISLPFKILLFVLTDGWNLIVKGLLVSYQ